jgi:hypothetical protein
MSKIYHYTKLNTAIEYILPTMTLRTNFLNKMNGPKENQPRRFGGMNFDYKVLAAVFFTFRNKDSGCHLSVLNFY